jgi:hypothetical protein
LQFVFVRFAARTSSSRCGRYGPIHLHSQVGLPPSSGPITPATPGRPRHAYVPI